MGKTLYLECNSGISGDMTVAALLDLGADADGLRKTLTSIPVDGYEIQISRVKKSGLDCCDFHVMLDHAHENHDHDMEYLHGHHHHHDHHDGHAHEHHHNHDHDGHEHHHHHEHRNLPDILHIIEHTELSQRAKETASRIFEIIASAEAKAHGEPMEQVHFHEVGAVDSIVDVIAIAFCLDDLGIEKVIVPYLCEGSGTIRCQHGIIPVPVPAVVNIVQEHHLSLKMTGIQGELVTPTGAAVVAAIQTGEKLPERFTVQKTGLGAGKRNYERPSILRAFLIESAEEASEKDTICKLETAIDDCTGEQLGYAMECLFAAGAKDVYYSPIYMKKNRPAYELTVLCEPQDVESMEAILFRETTTIGVRRCEMERHVLAREKETHSTKYGDVQVKKCILPDGSVRFYPEYDSIKLTAAAMGVPFGDMLQAVLKAVHNKEEQ